MSESQGECGFADLDFRRFAASGSQRQRMLQAATELLAEQQKVEGILEKSIQRSGCSREQAAVFFSRDVELVHAIYARVTFELEERLDELPADSWQIRFAAMMQLKFSIAAPYRSALSSIAMSALDSQNEHAVWNAQTESIRGRNLAVIERVIHGATHRPHAISDLWVLRLYSLHLAMMFSWCLARDPLVEMSSLDRRAQVVFEMGQRAIESLDSPIDLERTLQQLLDTSGKGPTEGVQGDSGSGREGDMLLTETKVLSIVFQRRRLIPEDQRCLESPCEHCFSLQKPKLRYFLSSRRPIHFVLPAFPAKSPSRSKTLGVKPDKAEEIGLLSLQSLCREIQSIYRPGATISICSDGHVFSDCVGVSDDQVTEYAESLRSMIAELQLESLSVFDMRQVYDRMTFDEMRKRLLQTYAMSTSELERRTLVNPQQKRLVDGIHRFLFEELIELRQEWSRTKCRNICRPTAYETVRRSDAWGKLLADAFPYSLRLSIHPQAAHSQKIGILLGRSDDLWLTPWHSAAVSVDGDWRLMKVKDAEAMGASVVNLNGVASHFQIP